MSALTRFPQAAGRRYQVTSEEDARQAFRWLCEDHAETLTGYRRQRQRPPAPGGVLISPVSRRKPPRS